jgi:dTDP-glucose pyrophosphorylase
MAVVGVIPAAGYATRLQPIDCSKEVYPLGGRPVIDYIVERMRRAPCDELRVVTRPDKRDVLRHAKARGARVVEGNPPSLGASLLLGIEDLADDDVVLIGFPDSIWEPADGYARVLELLRAGWTVGLGLFEVGGDMRRFEPVLADDDGRVRRIEFKPDEPSSEWLWGCAALPAGVLRGLLPGQEPGVMFDELAGRGLVGAVRLSGDYVDVGTRESLARAEAALGGACSPR